VEAAVAEPEMRRAGVRSAAGDRLPSSMSAGGKRDDADSIGDDGGEEFKNWNFVLCDSITALLRPEPIAWKVSLQAVQKQISQTGHLRAHADSISAYATAPTALTAGRSKRVRSSGKAPQRSISTVHAPCAKTATW
jgi:hypothetical protein